MDYLSSTFFQGMEYVYAVYKEGSFSKAAKAMYISQPSLSASVKRVESKLGYPIFERSSKDLKLTDPGKEYMKAVEKILHIQQSFEEYLNDLGNLKTGSLTLGGSNLYASWFLPPLMQQFSERYPDIKLRLVEDSTPELIRRLRHEEIDILLDNLPLNEIDYQRKKFRSERLYLAVPAFYEENVELTNWCLTLEEVQDQTMNSEPGTQVPLVHTSEPVTQTPLVHFGYDKLRAFQKRPFILLKPENDTRIRAEKICRKAGFQPQVRFEVDQQMTAYHITCAGSGISFVSDTLLSFANFTDDVVYYRLPDDYCKRTLYCYWKSGRYMSRAMDAFLREIK